ncbi:hypothetical protein Dimus_017897 [Dionaea muscipula]
MLDHYAMHCVLFSCYLIRETIGESKPEPKCPQPNSQRSMCLIHISVQRSKIMSYEAIHATTDVDKTQGSYLSDGYIPSLILLFSKRILGKANFLPSCQENKYSCFHSTLLVVGVNKCGEARGQGISG